MTTTLYPGKVARVNVYLFAVQYFFRVNFLIDFHADMVLENWEILLFLWKISKILKQKNAAWEDGIP